jgi:hypothetical protein
MISHRRARPRPSWTQLLLALVSAAALVPAASASAAEPSAPWWQLGSEVAPSNLPPEGTGEIVLTVTDLGDGPALGGSGSPVTVTDTLPEGLTATGIVKSVPQGQPEPTCKLITLQCTYEGAIYPYQRLTVTLKVTVKAAPGMLEDHLTVEGGGAPRATSTQQLTVSGESTPFGIQSEGYQLAPLTVIGEPATQAGSHPFQLTSTLVLDQTAEGGKRLPVALPKDLRFQLPPGLVGDPNATEQCSMAEFYAVIGTTDLCPPSTAVGVATATVYEPASNAILKPTVPLFNLVPSEGEPARFGFVVQGKVPIVIDTSLKTGTDYGVVADVQNTTEFAGLLSSQVTFWGVPGDPRHDQARGWECVGGGSFDTELETSCPTEPPPLPETPLLTLPTACAADPKAEVVSSAVEVDSWAQPLSRVSAEEVWSNSLREPLGFADCGELPFSPSLGVSAERASGSTPSAVDVAVRVPQAASTEPNPDGRAEADVRSTTVRLPAGVDVSPSAANGLLACPQTAEGGVEGIGFTGFAKYHQDEPVAETATFTPTFRYISEEAEGHTLSPSCPAASKVGTVRIRTPLLPEELEGGVYLAAQDNNPFGSLLALYIGAVDKKAGVVVKLAGQVTLNEQTGQLTTTFKNTPQLPFEELKLHLFGGPRASLSTPAACGAYQAASVFNAWSGALAEPVSEPSLTVTSGAGGGPCTSGALPFTPAFDAESANALAGALSSFTVELERPDGDQALTGVAVHLPPGIAALLSSVTPCAEPPTGGEWACGQESLIGHSTAWSGLGPEPVMLGGDVYLTTGYDGAPFGLLVRTHAAAGPFALGWVNVRSRINVDPNTAAVTITTVPGPHNDGLPTMLKGIPVQLKQLNVTIDRAGFQLNPTSCDPMRIEGTLDGSEGAVAGVSSPFQVGGCASLPFHPTLEASTDGQASKADGASLTVKITSAGLGQANIQKVFLTIPKILPSRLQPTLQHACPEAIFDANPAGCDEDSLIGYATVHTPILKSPLTGPAYVVSHGSAAFPDIEFVLQGEGITLVLDGKTDITHGVTYSRFESAPDAPFTSFETVLPTGPHSVLAVNTEEAPTYDLCTHDITIPTVITAQDGAVIEQSTKLQVEGCGTVKASRVKQLTRAQQLSKALAKCRSTFRHSGSKRAACERKADASYTTKALAECRKADRRSSEKRRECEARVRTAYAARRASRR